MPALTNAKHERFAQELAKGKTADDAYVEAGYKPSRANASTLRTKQNISARVAELLERAAARLATKSNVSALSQGHPAANPLQQTRKLLARAPRLQR